MRRPSNLKKRFSGPKGRETGDRSSGSSGNFIWGYHSLEGVLVSYPELVLDIFSIGSSLEDNKEGKRLMQLIKNAGHRVQTQSSLPSHLQDKRTQGVWARLKYFPTLLWKNFYHSAKDEGGLEQRGQWLLLDRIQDPRNYGAILRSAAAMGVEAVFVAERNQSPLSGVVAQASAGQCFRVPIVVYSSLATLMKSLKEDFAFFCLGLDAAGEDMESFIKEKWPGHADRVLWLVGSEGEGLKHSAREALDATLSIKMSAGVESLNAGVATALGLFAVRAKLSNL